MVTTRRQSKDFEPVELPRVTHQKRKRSNDAAPLPSTAQLPLQPSTKRRKKVKSTAKVDTPPLRVDLTPTAQPKASTRRKAKQPLLDESTEGKVRRPKPQAKNAVRPKAGHTTLNGAPKSAEVGLTLDIDTSDDESSQRPRPAASQDAEDEDADSRYALGPRKKGNTKKPAAPAVRQTAELKFEDDGPVEVDKAEAALAAANNGTLTQSKSLPLGPADGTKINHIGPGIISKVSGQSKHAAKKHAVLPSGVPSRTVMFTILEAIATLSLYKDGTFSVPAEIDPQSRQPYEPLQTGDFLSYPVQGTYHLGALGRYGDHSTPPLPFSLTVPLSEHSIILHTRDISAAEPSKPGLGFSSGLPTRPQARTVRRPNNYCFTWGKHRGRRMDSVPITYLRSIYNSDEYHADPKLQQAFADLYPKGLYESEAESFTFEKGGFKGKRFDEVPKSYLWGLLRKMNEGEQLGGKKGRGRLERALEVWEKGQLDFTKD